jgi:hypothetical protein
MEHRLEQARSEMTGTNNTLDDDNDVIRRQRIKLAQLEDTFYDDDEEEVKEDEEDDSGDSVIDRRRRFRGAYNVALSTDTQGYQVRKQDTGDRTAQELTAVSWAAFCTDLLPDEDATFRIQAMDSEDLFERLKLALSMLRQKKDVLQAKMERAGIKFRSEDGEMDGFSDD